MPVRKNRQSVEEIAEPFVSAMVRELDADEEAGSPDAPTIIEDYQTFADRFSVRVVWDRWQGVPPAERVPMILESYRRSKRKDEAANITAVRGLTPSEARMEEMREMMQGDTASLKAAALRAMGA